MMRSFGSVGGGKTRRWFVKALALGAASRLVGNGGPTGPLPLGPLADSASRVRVLDPRFRKNVKDGAAIRRLQTGSTWSEGPAWDTVGKRLVWSDVPNGRQWTWSAESGAVSILRDPSGQANGSCFDAQGRMICCEQVGRRVVRYERSGEGTILVDRWDGKPLNSPNDVVVHPDGAIWFTDPGYGNEGPLQLKEATYRIDPKTGAAERVDSTLIKPNGLCFSHDFKRLYVADTGKGGLRSIYVFDVVDGKSLANRRVFGNIELDGLVAGPDGQQVDVDGNLWASSGHGVDGVNGVHVFSPDGTRIGAILLPETCANVCIGGVAGKTLFMAATKSMYAVDIAIKGAHGS